MDSFLVLLPRLLFLSLLLSLLLSYYALHSFPPGDLLSLLGLLQSLLMLATLLRLLFSEPGRVSKQWSEK